MQAKLTMIAVVLWAATVPAFTQEPASTPVSGEKFYEELIRTPIVPQRSTEDIQADTSAAEKDMHQIDKSIAGAQARVKEAEGWIATQKTEIEALKKQADTAKKEKREADKLMLEAQRKQLELVQDYLKQMIEIREAELDLAKSQKDLVNAEMKVYQAERDLAKKADAMKKGQPAGPDFTKTVLEAAQAGEATLQLMKTMADKNADVAGKMNRLANKRVGLVQARNKLLSEERIRRAATPGTE